MAERINLTKVQRDTLRAARVMCRSGRREFPGLPEGERVFRALERKGLIEVVETGWDLWRLRFTDEGWDYAEHR